MKFSSLLCAGTLAVAAVAIPLADLEREHFGRTLQRREFSPELVKRMPKGSSSRPSRDRDQIQRIKSRRWQGDDETRYDYSQRIRDTPQYSRGWDPVRQTTPPRGNTGVVIRDQGPSRPVRADHYYAEDTQPYTADLWSKTTKVYPGYESHGFRHRGGADIRDYTLETPHIATPTWARGTDREEEPPQSYAYPQGAFLSGRVPREESKFQSTMFGKVNRAHPDAENYFHDNRLDRSANVHVVRGPRASESNGAYGYDPRYGIPKVRQEAMDTFFYPGQRPQRRNSDAQYVTIAPRYSSSRSSHYYDRRDVDAELLGERDIFDNIEGQQANASDTSRTAQMQQIEGFMWAFQEARDNATVLLQPFLEDLLNGTNSYLGESMAWGLYQMVNPDTMYFGPFMYGTTSFGSAADNSTANSTSTGNATDDQIWGQWGDAVNDFYAELWSNATAVVNATGLLGDMEKMMDNLTPTDRTLLPDSYTTMDDHDEDSFYGFLASMYTYNGYVFTANDTADGYADFSLYDDDFADDSTANGTLATNATQAKRSRSWVVSL